MDSLLSRTPYLLNDEKRAQRVLQEADDLTQQVSMLRHDGKLDEKTLSQLRREWGFQQVHESARIEGNTLTLNETQMAIQRGITISGKPPEHSTEVQNLYRAHEFMETLASQAIPISEREIREIQSLIVGGEARESGTYRTVEVAITNSPHKPPHPVKLPEAMSEYAAWLRSSEDLPVSLRVAVCHAWLAHIHPFRDGNGRTSRAVMNLLLIRAGYPIVVIRSKDRQRYYEALRESDDGDITPLLELIVERAKDSLKQIDRVRAAHTGLSLAIQRVLAQEARTYRVWADAIGLFASTLESTARELEAEGVFQVGVQRYDLPDNEDYQLMCEGDARGNTWLMKVRMQRHAQSHSFLLWIGFSSETLRAALGLERHIPAIKISVPNPRPPPVWIEAGPDFAAGAQEFAYSRGRFFSLKGNKITEIENLPIFLTELLAKLIEEWFVAPE